MALLVRCGIKVENSAVLELDEEELAALDALAVYSVESFLKTFYAQLGRAYLQPHEQGLRSFLAAVRGCKGMNAEAEECRQFLRESKESRRAAIAAMKETKR